MEFQLGHHDNQDQDHNNDQEGDQSAVKWHQPGSAAHLGRHLKMHTVGKVKQMQPMLHCILSGNQCILSGNINAVPAPCSPLLCICAAPPASQTRFAQHWNPLQTFKGILRQQIFYWLNHIFWIVNGGGVSCLKIPLAASKPHLMVGFRCF